MITFLKNETYGYDSRYSLKILWSQYTTLTWYGELNIFMFQCKSHLLNPFKPRSYKRDSSKQCRPRSDAAERGV